MTPAAANGILGGKIGDNMLITRSRKSEVILDCVNRSTVVGAADFLLWMKAQQAQLDNEFGAEWDTVVRIGSSQLETMPARAWSFVLLDDSDQAGALGYHDVVTAGGQPLGKAFAKTDLQHGYNWTVTASHEVLETLADPDINRVVMLPSGNSFILAAYEVCDACEADAFGKTIKGVVLSDFVTRAWFQPGATGPMDAYGHLSRPLEIANGGYIGVFVPGHGWTQATHLGSSAGEGHPLTMGAGTRHLDLRESPRREARFSRTAGV